MFTNVAGTKLSRLHSIKGPSILRLRH